MNERMPDASVLHASCMPSGLTKVCTGSEGSRAVADSKAVEQWLTGRQQSCG